MRIMNPLKFGAAGTQVEFPSTEIPGNSAVTIRSISRDVPFRGRRLVAEETMPGALYIAAIDIAGVPQLPPPREPARLPRLWQRLLVLFRLRPPGVPALPIAAFSPFAHDNMVAFSTCPAGASVEITVINTARAPVRLDMRLHGRVPE